jgi:hypothetical protein
VTTACSEIGPRQLRCQRRTARLVVDAVRSETKAMRVRYNLGVLIILVMGSKRHDGDLIPDERAFARRS